MHIVCLGILPTMMGAIVFEIFTSLGGSLYASGRHEIMQQINSMCRCMAREHGDLPFVEIKLNMVRTSMSKHPCLKLKAAEARYFLPVLRRVLMNCVDISSPHAVLRFNCLNELFLCYHELENWSDVHSMQRLSQHGRKHLQLFMELQHEAVRNGDEKLWHTVPKHHLFAHFLDRTRGTINPRLLWNYGFESEGSGNLLQPSFTLP